MLQPKKPVKKYVPTAKEKKNLEDASHNRNMRPPFTPEERKKMKNYSNMGKAKSGTKMKKAQEGVLTYTTPRGKKYSLPQGTSGPLNITRPNGSTRTIEDREKYTKKMQRVMRRNTVDGVNQGTMTREKNGGAMKKAKSGTSLGMKSVKAGFDKNPGVTRADIITAAKGKAKSGKSMKKCKYGCK